MTAPAVPRETSRPAPRPVASLDDILLELVDVGDNVRVDPGELEELAASIAELGILSPVKVTSQPDGRYRLVYGQRRVLASRSLGRLRIPAIIEPAGDVDPKGARRSIEQLAENLQRKDLNPIEEAVALREVLDATPGLTQEALADRLGRSRPWVSNAVALMSAPEPVRDLLRSGELSPAHVKALKGLAPKTQVEVARRAVSDGLSAHALESAVQREKQIAEREQQSRQETKAAREAERAEVDASIASGFEKKKVGKDDLVIVDSGYSGNGGNEWLVERIKAAGFTNVRVSKGWNEVSGRSKGCDCLTWKATKRTSYHYEKGRQTNTHSVTVARACANPKHRQAAEHEAEVKRRDKTMTQEKVVQHVRANSAGWVASEAPTGAIAVQRILAEAALFSLLSYRLPEWSVGHGGTRTNPWAAIHGLTDEKLATELAMAIASDFRDHAGYHVGWDDLAAELGLIEPPSARPAKGRKAAAG